MFAPPLILLSPLEHWATRLLQPAAGNISYFGCYCISCSPSPLCLLRECLAVLSSAFLCLFSHLMVPSPLLELRGGSFDGTDDSQVKMGRIKDCCFFPEKISTLSPKCFQEFATFVCVCWENVCCYFDNFLFCRYMELYWSTAVPQNTKRWWRSIPVLPVLPVYLIFIYFFHRFYDVFLIAATEWHFAWLLLQLLQSSDLQEEKVRILRSLGITSDPALIQRTLEFSLSVSIWFTFCV